MGTCTLGRVCGKILLCFYFTREFWGAVLPEGSTPQWEGGVARAHYVQRARVLSVCKNFSGDAHEFFLLMCARVHTCTCVCCIVCMQVRLP